MNIIIVGCGNIGETLANELNESGNNITIVDLVREKVRDIAERYDVMGVVGNGATHTTQRDAGIANADLLIAVTNSDELNLLCCIVAKREGNCKTIARIKNPIYTSETAYLKDELGLEMVINPEMEAAEEIARILRFPTAIKIDTFAGGRIEIMKYRLPSGSLLCDMAVRDVVAKLKCNILFCSIERDGEVYIANGDFVFAGEDVISFIASPKNAYDFFKKIGLAAHSARDVIVAGGGRITHYLCEAMSRSSASIKVIEKDRAICDALCNIWGNVSVINGDFSKKEILLEEGISSADAFVALTPVDEENIILSLFAKNEGVSKLITKINRPDYDGVMDELKLDTTVYPKSVTSDKILAMVRGFKNSIGSNVETLYTLIPGKVEAAEFKIKESSAITGKPLSELKFKDGVLICAIIRANEVIMPRGNDVIMPGDSVIVVSGIKALHDITDVLR
jgi:trk system potassium uptake protein TrkA